MKHSRVAKGSSGKTRSRPDDAKSILTLQDAARRQQLVVIIGTGVSMSLSNGALPALAWRGLIENGFAFGVKKGKIEAKQARTYRSLLKSADLDDLLAAAEFMGRKLGAPHDGLYGRWLEEVFKSVQPANSKMENAIRALQARGIPLCTLNYDPLLEQVTELPAILMKDPSRVTAWQRRELGGILHLHGSWDAPATCILGIRDYETTLANDVRDLIQRSLAAFSRLLFIGCGDTFADPNFSALIRWLSAKLKTAAPQHYALVKDDELADRHADPAWHGFVEPLSYGSRHEDLPTFLLEIFPAQSGASASPKNAPSPAPSPATDHARILRDYQAFLIKDCGQMTIEGVRADMDTAQRRFDLERLFVPLQVLSSPPEIPENDPQRDEKLRKWQEANKEAKPFGLIFEQHPRLALLALPGGGKTLLLKRLTVAYADPQRRRASSDALPELDLLPVLIRCREWREYIASPILTLLANMSSITGQPSLEGLSDALQPLLAEGRVLLLVDGLDEIHDDALRTIFVDHLEAFLTDYPRIRLVVTSREAGFSLVAPCLARFCARWHVAPLAPEAITALCDHWHVLMKGDAPEAHAEGREVANLLVQNPSLLRLAENPLLLTMLLVVKHGNGRLPPDRVSLYSRAVEVLLDTWNIKGHEPLSPKEAVPQLAFVAFQMMRMGRQTATEKEILVLLEEARDRVPQIRRYAQDTPYAFLKRVELRSSLLVEAGRQRDGAGTVPFYQFRHLTFQEYLAAVAAVEGHYVNYAKTDTVLTPLAPHLLAKEWKEVVPMAAVLAKKQAEPLMAALVAEGNKLRQQVEAGKGYPQSQKWEREDKLLDPAARLLQCLSEEAEAAPETLTAALQVLAFFARGCQNSELWQTLVRGPYGKELIHQAWLLYAPMQWPVETWLLNTCSMLAYMRKPLDYWIHSEGQSELRACLNSTCDEEIARGLFTCAGLSYAGTPGTTENAYHRAVDPQMEIVERHLFQKDPALWAVAAAVHLFRKTVGASRQPATIAVLERLLSLWLSERSSSATEWVEYALATHCGLPRNSWRPVLTATQAATVRQRPPVSRESASVHHGVRLRIAFYARNVWTEEELAQRLDEWRKSADNSLPSLPVDAMLGQMGEAGRKYLKAGKRQGRKKKAKE